MPHRERGNQPAQGPSACTGSWGDGGSNEVEVAKKPSWPLTWWWQEGEAQEAKSCWSDKSASGGDVVRAQGYGQEPG